MKQFMDILAVIISGGFLVFAFFYIVNIQAALFNELTSENKPETSTKSTKQENNKPETSTKSTKQENDSKRTKTTRQEIDEINQRREKLQQEIEEIRQKRLKLEEEHARIDSFGFHLHSKRKY